METYQTYPGRVRNGRPTVAGNVALPENATIFVTVIDAVTSRKLSARSREATMNGLEDFLVDMAKIDEALDEEFGATLAKPALQHHNVTT
ncbi:MAG: hypothetical protein LBH03_05790 [Holophagales bacterium]|jgi:hypothetical protein|nr:hypothetical protein [Holophagales bacterium]